MPLKQVAPVEPATHWQVVRCGEWIWKLRTGVDPAQEWLRDPVTFARRDEMLLKPPVPRSGTRVVRMKSSSGPLVLKEYCAASFRETFKRLLRGPRAWQSLEMALRLRQVGLPTIDPLAAGYARRKPWHSFLVTQELSSIVAARLYARESARQRRELVRSLARVMASLHRAGFLHGDAHMQNFVWQRLERPQLLMVDVDGVRECGNMTLLQAACDLARLLDYTEPGPYEVIRFAVEYCRLRGDRLLARELVGAMKTAYLRRARV